MTATRIVPQDAPTLASDAELAAHEADTTAIHGITDTAALVVDGDAAGGELAGTYPNPTVAATHSGSAHHAAVTVGTGLDVTGQLVELDLSEVAAGGELGGFMDAPTVDSTHSGSTHAATQTAAEATAAGALSGHAADSTAIHGITDTSVLATATDVSGAVATHAGLADPHTGYRLESADHTHASTGLQAGQVAHSALSGITANDHHAQVHAADHLPTGTDPIDKFSQSNIGTADLAIANTETVVVSDVFAANELTAGMTFMFRAQATRAGVASASEVIRIRIGTTTLIGNIAATLTPPVSTLAVPVTIEGIVTIRSAGAGGSALGSLERRQHLAAVTITSAINPLTATVAVNTTSANQRVELTFISGSATNTYTFRNAVMYRVA